MSVKLRNIILLILLTLVITSYFLPELKLFANSFRYNSNNIDSISINHFENITDKTYKVSFNYPNTQEIDLSKSYVTLKGSSYIFSDNPDEYSYILDKLVEISRVQLSNTDKTQIDENTVTVTDPSNIQKTYSVITEIFLYTKSGDLIYDWQITTFDKLPLAYWTDRISYLVQNLVWFFAIFGFFSFKNNYGVVYDSKTKKPISGVITRIFKDGTLYTTYITNILGFINLRFPKGKYKIEISKPGYTFPSSLKPLSYDGHYHNLYYGDDFNIPRNSSKLSINIPLDPENYTINTNPVNNLLLGTLSTLNNFNPILLFIVVFSQIISWPKSLDTWIFALVSLTLFIIKYLLYVASQPSLGKVVDSNGKMVPNVTFQIYDSTWNKQISTFTSNSKGKYEAIVLNDQYYIKIMNPEYQIVGADVEGKLKIQGKLVNNNLHITDTITIKPVSLQTPS